MDKDSFAVRVGSVIDQAKVQQAIDVVKKAKDLEEVDDNWDAYADAYTAVRSLGINSQDNDQMFEVWNFINASADKEVWHDFYQILIEPLEHR